MLIKSADDMTKRPRLLDSRQCSWLKADYLRPKKSYEGQSEAAFHIGRLLRDGENHVLPTIRQPRSEAVPQLAPTD